MWFSRSVSGACAAAARAGATGPRLAMLKTGLSALPSRVLRAVRADPEIEGSYDVGVILSTDNDLLPALEVVRNYDPSRVHVAVAAWSAPGNHQRLRLPGLWCHWLDQADYNAVADTTRY